MSALEIFQRVRYSEFWDRSFLYVTIAWGDDKKEKSFPAEFPSKENFYFYLLSSPRNSLFNIKKHNPQQ